MLKPSPNDIFSDNRSRYSFVIAVAKRAREIVDEAEAAGTVLTESRSALRWMNFPTGNTSSKRRKTLKTKRSNKAEV